MTDFALHNERVFPVGTTVKAYLVSDVGPVIPSGVPSGLTERDSKVVQAGGVVTFTGLTAGVAYYAVANSRWVRFVPGATAPAAASNRISYDPDTDTVNVEAANFTVNGSPPASFAHLVEDAENSLITTDWSVRVGRDSAGDYASVEIREAEARTLFGAGALRLLAEADWGALLQVATKDEAGWRLEVHENGSLHWGDGSAAPDTHAARAAAGALFLHGSDPAVGVYLGVEFGYVEGSTDAPGTTAFGAQVTGDAVDRFEVHGDGSLHWGGGAGAPDIHASRFDVGLFQFGDNDAASVSIYGCDGSYGDLYIQAANGADHIELDAEQGLIKIVKNDGGIQIKNDDGSATKTIKLNHAGNALVLV